MPTEIVSKLNSRVLWNMAVYLEFHISTLVLFWNFYSASFLGASTLFLLNVYVGHSKSPSFNVGVATLLPTYPFAER
jgi:hypothetical protein